MYIVGKVLKPQGVRGEVKVGIITSFPEHFTAIEEVFLEKDDHWKAWQIENVRIAGRFAFIKFANIGNRDQAEELRDQLLYIPDNELKELEEDEYYVHDLIGLDVFDEQGNRLGSITDVESYKSNDVYLLQTENGEEHLIPAVKDFIVEVDISNRKMVIRRIEGLIE